MQMTDKFIVHPLGNERYLNTQKLGEKTLIINTSIEHAKDVNRIGVIVSLPINYSGNVMVGDNVVLQHNVFRSYFDGAGIIQESDWHIKDNLFFVQPELVYLIIRGEKKIAVDNFCFIIPIFEEERWKGSVEQEHVGIVKYSNETLKQKGIIEGDKIAFHTDAEYEFTIEGERLYRVKSYRILAKLKV